MDWAPIVASLPQGGSIVAFIAVVVLFLNHIKEANTTLGAMHRDCEGRLHDITKECTEVVKDNTKALVQLESAVKELVVHGRK